MEGTIFDIQKFALHDGPGIRTAVFLKGCPLKCIWCCNPESQSADLQIGFSSSRCNNCFKCIPICKQKALQIDKDKLSIDYKLCNACGLCAGECHKNALKVYGYKIEAAAVIAEAVKDKAYYDNSGGGITFTGGEPMEQIDFLVELLTKAKHAGLQTCIETSGYAPEADFRKVLPLTDLFFVDYKLTDNFYHKRYTGKENELILINIKLLHDQGAKIIVRCPIIPEINDTDDHFHGIAQLSNTFTRLLSVELMPYHDYGSHKYAEIGKTLYPIDSNTVTHEKANYWLHKIISFGGRNIFLND